MSENAEPDLAGLYRETRLRLTELVSGLDAAALATAVPACPGWAVRDVVAHLTAVAEDAVAGKLTGPPPDEVTAAQVARLADVDVPGLLDRWAVATQQFEHRIDAFKVWPAVIDVASHEQDIRGALGMPGARDTAAIRHCAAWLLAELRVPVPLRIRTEDGDVLAGPGGAADPGSTADPGGGTADPSGMADAIGVTDPDGTADTSGAPYPGGPAGRGSAAELTLSTSRFEAFRWRMGRRSLAQLAALRWTGDPAQVLGQLAIFGPAADDIHE
jgi:uncharacterized protein (TIGR03083 family)